jgi:hypothetical protein
VSNISAMLGEKQSEGTMHANTVHSGSASAFMLSNMDSHGKSSVELSNVHFKLVSTHNPHLTKWSD